MGTVSPITDPAGFAKDWIASFNSHEIDWIVSHYAEDVMLTSVLVQRVMGEPSGQIRGKASLRTYFTSGLTLRPDLQFTLLDVFHGLGSMILRYRTRDGRYVAELMKFNAEGLIYEVNANYAPVEER